jgi:hypothetical protein
VAMALKSMRALMQALASARMTMVPVPLRRL